MAVLYWAVLGLAGLCWAVRRVSVGQRGMWGVRGGETAAIGPISRTS